MANNIKLTVEHDGQVIYTSVCPERKFTSGKKGFGAYGKTMLPDGTALQVSCNFVIPKSEEKAAK
jgi:hypothetical protein